MVNAVEVIINGARLLFGLIFVFFIPGYATMLAIFPKKDELSFAERIAFSGVISIVVVVLVAISIDIGFGAKTTPSNLFVSLLIFTILMITVWRVELVFINRKNEEGAE